jgi:hypothetical protein
MNRARLIAIEIARWDFEEIPLRFLDWIRA